MFLHPSDDICTLLRSTVRIFIRTFLQTPKKRKKTKQKPDSRFAKSPLFIYLFYINKINVRVSEGSRQATGGSRTKCSAAATEVMWINLNRRYCRSWLCIFSAHVCKFTFVQQTSATQPSSASSSSSFLLNNMFSKSSHYLCFFFFSLLQVKFPQCPSQWENTLCEFSVCRSNEGKLCKGIARAAVLTRPGSVPAIRSNDPLWP